MNTLKVHGLLSERYPSHFLDFTHKITNPIFGTPCSYSNTVMRSPLKEKIQNAINRAINDCNHYNDCNNNGDGALIVGGRRRNRKKKNKKNGQKKKKSPSLESIKARLSPSGCRKGGKEQDNAPLINEGDNENKENENDEKMPFGFSKKKTPKEEKKTENAVSADDITSNKDDVKVTKETDDAGPKNDVQNGDVANDTDKNVKEDTMSNDVTNKAEQEVKANGVVAEVPSEPMTKIETSKVDGKPVVSFAAEPEKDGSQPSQGEDGALTTGKSEKSRLIDKSECGDSTFKDQQPGFLCCVIL